MNILIPTYMCRLLNHGDTAMLQTAVKRLKTMWPEANIHVLVRSAERMKLCCPDAKALLDKGRHNWFCSTFISSRLSRILSPRLFQLLTKFDETFTTNFPRLAYAVISIKHRLLGRTTCEKQLFWNALMQADLVFAAGGGHITDAFEQNALFILKTMKISTRLRKKTVMLGQGIGPISHMKLRSLAGNVLPHVDFIALREQRTSLPLLLNLGVEEQRLMTTGDDAIEMAHRQKTSIGTYIGVNLRVSSYSNVPDTATSNIRRAFQICSSKLKTSFMSVPISLNEEDSDAVTIQNLLVDLPCAGGAGENLNTPGKVIEQVTQCRIMITGSYHAAVFALSQGIPVIGLARSQYYKNKFAGLADQFGGGCQVVLLDDCDLTDTLIKAIQQAWISAPDTGPKLAIAAKRQIKLSQTAYQKTFTLVNHVKH